MQDIVIQASLKSAKFTARKHPDKPDTMIRRVQFQLQCADFSHEHAEWLGDSAMVMREKLQSRDLNSFDLPINAYHAKMEASGLRGNATAEVDGVCAVAAVVGQEEKEHEELTLTFEAPCEAALLTFIGSSLKETVEVSLKASQLKLTTTGDDGIRQAVDRFKAAIPKGTTVTMHVEGKKKGTIEGTGAR